ncbi:FkbM family methyltransferase [Leptolyngbya sp. NK1-12]|uniref:FkbM family methyltransferase n=1 Tax=Leptolyngbya sp. NK1-12 TaxID=2547451 RepID=A0AA96WKK8_9CYAN|nr:FkbM family methyltransferase [Leptolyngbya sp. NK1-12]WNZ27308.1 FkbM family methyltransferase [Leptolyngbya sp. NK1-12]
MKLRSKVRKYLTRKLDVPEISLALERLSHIGFQPQQIFDVGAYRGDFAQICLHIWPDAHITCFEVLENQVAQLNRLASQHTRIQVLPTLLGSESREKVALHEAETASSILAEHISQDFAVTYHPMQTVDQVVQGKLNGRIPDLLKLDVQGYELEVLKGAEQSLSNIQVILAEVNLLDIHKDVPLLANIIAWLDQRDWVAYDICGLTRRPLDRALWQADMIFVPRNSSFRLDKRWAA